MENKKEIYEIRNGNSHSITLYPRNKDGIQVKLMERIGNRTTIVRDITEKYDTDIHILPGQFLATLNKTWSDVNNHNYKKQHNALFKNSRPHNTIAKGDIERSEHIQLQDILNEYWIFEDVFSQCERIGIDTHRHRSGSHYLYQKIWSVAQLKNLTKYIVDALFCIYYGAATKTKYSKPMDIDALAKLYQNIWTYENSGNDNIQYWVGCWYMLDAIPNQDITINISKAIEEKARIRKRMNEHRHKINRTRTKNKEIKKLEKTLNGYNEVANPTIGELMQKFYCKRCHKYHTKTSKIGRKHLKELNKAIHKPKPKKAVYIPKSKDKTIQEIKPKNNIATTPMQEQQTIRAQPFIFSAWIKEKTKNQDSERIRDICNSIMPIVLQ